MAKPTTNKFRILVVDDEPLVCEAVRMLLVFDGHDVETARDGATALTLVSPDKFDLVLVDFEMPGMKGDQLAAALKEKLPNLPVLMLTAHGDMWRSSGRHLPGVDLIVDKPFRLETLREGITQVMAAYAANKTE